MKIERTEDEIIIRVPIDTDLTGLERMLDFIKYKESTKKSKVSQKVVDALSNEVNKSIWDDFKAKRNFQ